MESLPILLWVMPELLIEEAVLSALNPWDKNILVAYWQRCAPITPLNAT